GELFSHLLGVFVGLLQAERLGDVVEDGLLLGESLVQGLLVSLRQGFVLARQGLPLGDLVALVVLALFGLRFGLLGLVSLWKGALVGGLARFRSEEHTSELQSR